MLSIQVLLLSDLDILYLTEKVYTVKTRRKCNAENGCRAMELFWRLALKSICLLQMLVFFSSISCFFCERHLICSLHLNAFHIHQQYCHVNCNFQEIISCYTLGKVLISLQSALLMNIGLFTEVSAAFLVSVGLVFSFPFLSFSSIFFLYFYYSNTFYDCVLLSESCLSSFILEYCIY